MPIGHYKPEIVGAKLRLARDSELWTMLMIGDSNHGNDGGQVGAVYYGENGGLTDSALDTNGINFWCFGPYNSNAGACQTAFGQPDTTSGGRITAAATSSTYADSYLLQSLTSLNANGFQIANGVSATNGDNAGILSWRSETSETLARLTSAFQPDEHNLSFFYRWYEFSTGAGSDNIQHKVTINGVTKVSDTLHTVDGGTDQINFQEMGPVASGVFSPWASNNRFLFEAQAGDGLAIWSDIYMKYNDVSSGLHFCPLWVLGGGGMSVAGAGNANPDLVRGTPANDLFLQQRLKDIAALQGAATPKCIVRIALGGNDWSSTTAQQNTDRQDFIDDYTATIDHIEAVWTHLGYPMADLVFLLVSYNDRSEFDNPSEYGFRSDIKNIATGRSRCSFIDQSVYFTAAEMSSLGYYNPGDGDDAESPHRSRTGYSDYAELEMSLLLSASGGIRGRAGGSIRVRGR